MTHPAQTLRDYFAAHAPAEPPAWFTWPTAPFVFEAAPPEPDAALIDDEELRAMCKSWLRDPGFDLRDALEGELPAQVVAFEAAADTLWKWDERRKKAAQQHELAGQRERYIAWRWAYADMMIAQREPLAQTPAAA